MQGVQDGYYKGIKLCGRVKVVDSFPDDIGEWKFMKSGEDLTVQFVDSFPDIKIKYVNSFPLDYVTISLKLSAKHREYAHVMQIGIQQVDMLREAVVCTGFSTDELKTTDFSIDSEYEIVDIDI
ncbi:hypothetical protein [Anaerovibrio sp.]|uniref:hypothetical protein n=1 Tax=Anaerovibrio sp. TaxID=1872532 RepID=UPI00388E7F77